MHAAEQPTSEFKITATCTVTDPTEQQRRLAHAYGLIMEFGRQKRVLAKTKPDDLAKPAD